MQRLRAKSIQLTDFLESLLLPSLAQHLQLVTPHRSEERGAQLSLRLSAPRDRARRVYDSLLPRGVVADWRIDPFISAGQVYGSDASPWSPRSLTRPASRIALISLSTWLTALLNAASPPSGQPSR